MVERTELVLIVMLLGSSISSVLAIPPTRTQVNQITDLFDTSVSNRREVERAVEGAKENAIGSARNASEVSKEEVVPNFSEGKAERENCSSIRANELEQKGRGIAAFEEFNNGGWLVNRNEVGLKPHYEDAEKIVSASERLMNHLLAELKQQGIDCKELRRDDSLDPQWKILIEQQREKEVIYDKFYCEQRSNSYSCADELTMNCSRRGMRFLAWQNREMWFSGQEVRDLGYYIVFWKRKRWGGHFGERPSSSSDEIRGGGTSKGTVRNEIARRLGVRLEQIEENVQLPNRGVGEPYHSHDVVYMFPRYQVKYQYRDGEEICEQWQETWDERCTLNRQ